MFEGFRAVYDVSEMEPLRSRVGQAIVVGTIAGLCVGLLFLGHDLFGKGPVDWTMVGAATLFGISGFVVHLGIAFGLAPIGRTGPGRLLIGVLSCFGVGLVMFPMFSGTLVNRLFEAVLIGVLFGPLAGVTEVPKMYKSFRIAGE
jgi:hypothetical protein